MRARLTCANWRALRSTVRGSGARSPRGRATGDALLWCGAVAAIGMAGCRGSDDDTGQRRAQQREVLQGDVGVVGAGGGAVLKDVGVSRPIERLSYPGTQDGARALLMGFLGEDGKADVDRVAMTGALRPDGEDYTAVFTVDGQVEVKDKYERNWDSGYYLIDPKPKQTELLLWSATTQDFREDRGDARKFPQGYRKIAGKLQPGLTFYRFVYVIPGETYGSAYDGLVFVRGHWIWMSKPYRQMQ